VPILASSPPHFPLLRGLVRRGVVQQSERRRTLRPLERRPDWLWSARRLYERVGPQRALTCRGPVHGRLRRHRGLPGIPERGPLQRGLRHEFVRRAEPPPQRTRYRRRLATPPRLRRGDRGSGPRNLRGPRPGMCAPEVRARVGRWREQTSPAPRYAWTRFVPIGLMPSLVSRSRTSGPFHHLPYTLLSAYSDFSFYQSGRPFRMYARFASVMRTQPLLYWNVV